LSNKKKRKEYDKYGHLDENDTEFEDFLNNLNFMDLAADLLGDLAFINDLSTKKSKSHVFFNHLLKKET